jgi:glycosyltransferase involved in cell wall biosynthesis
MVGMHLTKTRGGITTLTQAILDSRLQDDFDLFYVASQAEELGRIRKLVLACTAAIRFFGICIFRRPDLVYIHLGSNASLYRESAFVLSAKLLRTKVLSHFHAGDLEKYYPEQSNLGQRFIKLGIDSSDLTIAVSKDSARQLGRISSSPNIRVIPNTIDTSDFRSSKRRTKNDGEMVRLLFVGAIGKLKGEEDLIKALAMLKTRKHKLGVSFVGYGAERLAAKCSEFGIADLIEHLGPVPLKERHTFYHDADIFVLPTYAEAMPISVIEAMAAGLAIISTPVGGIPELIKDGQEGLLFQCGDVKALSDKISYLAENREARITMGAKARQRAKEQLNFPAYIEMLRSEIFQLCRSNP